MDKRLEELKKAMKELNELAIKYGEENERLLFDITKEINKLNGTFRDENNHQ